jgi:hemolysin activation/secretion protein
MWRYRWTNLDPVSSLQPCFETVLWIVCGFVALFLCGQAAAQQPSLPATIQPDIRLERLPDEQPRQPPPELRVPKSAPAQAPLGAETYRFILRGLIVEGATAFDADTIAAFSDDSIGEEISLADLYRIANEIKQSYREAGYFLTRVIVPAQNITDGQARIVVLEGYVSAIRWEQTTGAVDKLVADYLDPVLRERPLRLKTLERALLLANDIPGVTVQGILRPSKDALGAAELVVSSDRKIVDGVVIVDNFGDEFTGTWEGAVGVSSNALTQFGERIGVIGFATDPRSQHNEKVGQFRALWHFGGAGTSVDTTVSYGDSNPGATLREFDFDSKTLFASIGASHPFVRARDWNVSSRVAFEYLDSDTDIFFGQTFSRDRLRILDFTVNGDFRDEWRGATTLSASFRQGLPIFGATKSSDDNKSRDDGTGTSSVIAGTASRQQHLVHRFSAFVSAAGQFAFNDVLSDEEFQLGGTQFGRGYDFNEVSGDHGVGFTGELQYTQDPHVPALDRFQIFGFFDAGNAWDRGEGEKDHLSSAGFGVRLSLLSQLSVEIQTAWPLSRDSERSAGKKNPQLLLRAIGRF